MLFEEPLATLLVKQEKERPLNIVYFIVDLNNKVLYVGSTTKGYNRIYIGKTHPTNGYRKDLQDRLQQEDYQIYYMPIPKSKLKIIEQHYILKYKPCFNKRLPLRKEYGDISKIKELKE